MGSRSALACCLVLVLTAPSVRADEPPTPFGVEYAEGSACTGTELFSEELLRRTQRLRRANPDERALSFRIEVAPSGSLVGTLAVRELDGNQTTREVPGATCDELLSAMALIAAVLVDPNASAEPLPEPEAEPVPSPPLLEPVPTVSLARPRRPKPPPRPAPAEPQRPRSRFTFGGGAAFALEGAIGPDVTSALSLELEAALERGDLLSPLLVLAFERAFPTRSETPNGIARLQWTAGRASGCPLRFPASGPWALRPCVLFELGSLAASGERTERRAVTKVPWSALGGTLRVEYSPIAPLLVVVDSGFVAPLRHDTFYFDPPTPENTAFTVPSVGGTGRLGIATRFD